MSGVQPVDKSGGSNADWPIADSKPDTGFWKSAGGGGGRIRPLHGMGGAGGLDRGERGD